jgi:hypothetical protein
LFQLAEKAHAQLHAVAMKGHELGGGGYQLYWLSQ